VVTVAVLATLGKGVEPMLQGHSNIARHQGVSAADLRMIRAAHKQIKAAVVEPDLLV